MHMLGLNKTINRLVMANSVSCHGHVFGREGGHIF